MFEAHFEFKSYSNEDDDYEGYDYSLSGRMSAISVYFMELATPHNEEVIKMVDKVGDSEWMIQKYKIDEATAIKLDLSLETPVIIILQDSSSKKFASNEEDAWIRAVIKDLIIEAGSGLIILNPVDVSGAYTSVKDKTNISLMCTDMHFHLS